MNNQRPGPVDGMLREYFSDGFYIIEQLKDGEWVEVVKIQQEKVLDDE